jgi:hypothetical integral membrane protein (TIGR02206 family)
MTSRELLIESDDPKYWIMMIGALVLGFLLIKFFDRVPAEKKDSYLIRMGVIMVGVQLYIPVSQFLDPEYIFSYHTNLQLHFCGVNFWLIAINCFVRSRKLFVYTAYLGMVGGAYTFLTPIMTAGYSIPLFINFICVHGGLIFVPIVMMRHYGMEFRSYDWARAYGFDVVISTMMMVVNYLLNTYVDNPMSDPANYMFVMEIPDVSNPMLSPSLAWPFYMFPVHLIFIIHMLVINAFIRWKKGIKLDNCVGIFR